MKFIIPARANKEPTEMNECKKNMRNTHTRRRVKTTQWRVLNALLETSERTIQTQETKQLDWERVYEASRVSLSVCAFIASVCVCACWCVSEYISQLELCIHKNMIDELWFHIHNRSPHTHIETKQNTLKMGGTNAQCAQCSLRLHTQICH